jgi:CspA family cold shock protein
MPRGKIKWFNEKKGYGFISMEGSEADIFVHYSNVKMDGFKSLAEGQEVEFDLVQEPKGAKAVNIVPQ